MVFNHSSIKTPFNPPSFFIRPVPVCAGRVLYPQRKG
nr:MAG TPA: hypothetical protein [Caudoviricetes sp.]DAV86142.1 MAG TPA: hypothetical protein [Caudoviricetes sp.]